MRTCRRPWLACLHALLRLSPSALAHPLATGARHGDRTPGQGQPGAHRRGARRGRRCAALAYPSLVGIPQVGDDVLLNTTALAQGLGTGGVALVVAVPDRLPPDPEGPGHLVKARYTPLQVTVQGVDEQDTEHHALMVEADDLDGMPVVVADLHSALPGGADRHAGHRSRPEGRLRHDRRRRAAGRVLADAGRAGAPRWPGWSPSGRPGAGTSRRSRCTPGCSRPGTCCGRTWRSSRRGRATWARGRRGASPAWPRARRATRSPCSAATRSARCGSPTPIRGPGTAASPTTP